MRDYRAFLALRRRRDEAGGWHFCPLSLQQVRGCPVYAALELAEERLRLGTGGSVQRARARCRIPRRGPACGGRSWEEERSSGQGAECEISARVPQGRAGEQALLARWRGASGQRASQDS